MNTCTCEYTVLIGQKVIFILTLVIVDFAIVMIIIVTNKSLHVYNRIKSHDYKIKTSESRYIARKKIF